MKVDHVQCFISKSFLFNFFKKYYFTFLLLKLLKIVSYITIHTVGGTLVSIFLYKYLFFAYKYNEIGLRLISGRILTF